MKNQDQGGSRAEADDPDTAQRVKRTLKLADARTAVGPTVRSKMLAAGLKKRKKRSTYPRWWRCSPVLRHMSSRIASPRITRLGNSSFSALFFGCIFWRLLIYWPEGSSQYCKAAHSESLRCQRTHVLIVCILFLLVSV